MYKKSLSDYNFNSIGDLFELRKFCYSQLERSIKCLDSACMFYYIRLLSYVNYLIRIKGYK